MILVIKCTNLHKFKDSCINAYVKCAVVSLSNSCSQHNIYQRTTVHKNSSDPIFDQQFTFDVDESNDLLKNLQLAVWHRDKNLKWVKLSFWNLCWSYNINIYSLCHINMVIVMLWSYILTHRYMFSMIIVNDIFYDLTFKTKHIFFIPFTDEVNSLDVWHSQSSLFLRLQFKEFSRYSHNQYCRNRCRWLLWLLPIKSLQS